MESTSSKVPLKSLIVASDVPVVLVDARDEALLDDGSRTRAWMAIDFVGVGLPWAPVAPVTRTVVEDMTVVRSLVSKQ